MVPGPGRRARRPGSPVRPARPERLTATTNRCLSRARINQHCSYDTESQNDTVSTFNLLKKQFDVS